jgi:hypothetical protein
MGCSEVCQKLTSRLSPGTVGQMLTIVRQAERRNESKPGHLQSRTRDASYRGCQSEELLAAFGLSSERADAVIVNGGLGRKIDDL